MGQYWTTSVKYDCLAIRKRDIPYCTAAGVHDACRWDLVALLSRDCEFQLKQ